MTTTAPHPEPPRTTVLIHLNLSLPTGDPTVAEELAKVYCDEHGISDDAVLIEAQ